MQKNFHFGYIFKAFKHTWVSKFWDILYRCGVMANQWKPQKASSWALKTWCI